MKRFVTVSIVILFLVMTQIILSQDTTLKRAAIDSTVKVPAMKECSNPGCKHEKGKDRDKCGKKDKPECFKNKNCADKEKKSCPKDSTAKSESSLKKYNHNK